MTPSADTTPISTEHKRIFTMALIPNNPRIGGFMGQATLPGRPGVGNTGIVPPSMQQRPPQNVGTGGTYPPVLAPATNTGGPDPAYPRTVNTGGPMAPTQVPATLPPTDPAYPRDVNTGGNLPPTASPMASGTTMPGRPRPPSMPSGTQMALPATNAQGGRMARPMAIGRPAGGLFPRLG